MRSIRRRAGCSTVAKKSGSETATRSTGICRRANQTRTVAGIASSIRMLWNSSATISIVARSTGVVAACLSACLRWCSSSSSAGVLTGPATAGVGRRSRWRAGARRSPAPRRSPRSGAATAAPARARCTREVGQLAADEPVQPAEHRLGLVGAARQAGGARHQARLLADLAGRARRASPTAGTPTVARRHAGRRAEAAAGADRRQPPAVVRAADERPQVDLGQHVALRAGSGWSRGTPLRRRATAPRAAPTAAGARRRSRAARRSHDAGDDARQHVRAQDVVGVELLAASRACSCASAGR